MKLPRFKPKAYNAVNRDNGVRTVNLTVGVALEMNNSTCVDANPRRSPSRGVGAAVSLALRARPRRCHILASMGL